MAPSPRSRLWNKVSTATLDSSRRRGLSHPGLPLICAGRSQVGRVVDRPNNSWRGKCIPRPRSLALMVAQWPSMQASSSLPADRPECWVTCADEGTDSDGAGRAGAARVGDPLPDRSASSCSLRPPRADPPSCATLARMCSNSANQLTSRVAFPAERQSGSLTSIPSCPQTRRSRAIGQRLGFFSSARNLASSRSFEQPQPVHSLR